MIRDLGVHETTHAPKVTLGCKLGPTLILPLPCSSRKGSVKRKVTIEKTLGVDKSG